MATFVLVRAIRAVFRWPCSVESQALSEQWLQSADVLAIMVEWNEDEGEVWEA